MALFSCGVLVAAALCLAVIGPTAQGYMSTKDHFYADALLRELIDRMGKDLSDVADSYIDPLPPLNEQQLEYMARENKGMVDPEQLDYDALLMDGAPTTALRDQEFLQQNALWGHQYVSGGAGEGPHRLKPQIKTDASLPAYCNPPNPCPVGVGEEAGCLEEFENSASFSREYQASQECMCDAEHMFECPNQEENAAQRQINRDMDAFLAKQFAGPGHKNLVAKKYQLPQQPEVNPFLEGEKLPIAAKKGFHVTN